MSAAAIQKALYNALNGAISADVYDHVTQDAAFPYAVIGEDVVSPWDTDTSTGYDAVVTIHVWSRYRGKKEAKDLQKKIYDLLHRQQITIAGLHLVELVLERAEVVQDPDGLTYHGVQDFRLIADEP